MAESELIGPKVFLPFKYQCSFAGCDLQFRRKDRCDSHEYTHSKQKQFKCTEPNCDRAYITNCHLRRHKRTAHSEPCGPILCAYESCGEFFLSIREMNEHNRTIHSTKPSRQFQCDLCSEQFRRKIHLKKHLFAVHTGNYRYNCEKCGKGYLLESRLKRHKKVSHKTHECKLCSITFEKWSLFLAHKQHEHANTEIKCNICDKIFNSQRGLKEHRNTHLNVNERNEIPCTFDGCQKFFFRRSNMLAHYKLKHENQKFVCTHNGCNLELSTKQKLNQHIKVIHLGETGQKKRKIKVKTDIAKRKDTGVQKISTASKLFQVILPPEFEKAIISGHGKDIQIDYDPTDVDEEEREEEERVDKEKEKEEKNDNEQSNRNQFLGLAVINSTVDLLNSSAVKC